MKSCWECGWPCTGLWHWSVFDGDDYNFYTVHRTCKQRLQVEEQVLHQ